MTMLMLNKHKIHCQNLNRHIQQKVKHPFQTDLSRTMKQDRVEFKNQRENTNTKRKMNGCVNTFKTFLESVNGEHRKIFYLPPQTLDEYLQKFSIGLRKEKNKRR